MIRRKRHRHDPRSPDPYSTVTGYDSVRIGHITVVSVTTSLSGTTIYYHWYRDGRRVASTHSDRFSFRLPAGEQIRIDVLATTDKGWNVPQEITSLPTRQNLWWVASMSADIGQYRIEQKKDAGAYAQIGVMFHSPGCWTYKFMSPVLVDLSTYTWQIIPVDRAGNDGTPITLGPTKIVRTPDSPSFTATFDSGTTKVEFAEAA